MRELPTDPGRVELTDARRGHRSPISAMTTLFDLALVAVDRDQPLPLKVQRSLREITRVMTGADATVAVLAIGADAAGTTELAERLGTRCRVFTDAEGRDADALGLTATPGLVWVSTAPELVAGESGFDRGRWTAVLGAMADRWAWTRPVLPLDAPAVAHPLVVGARAEPATPEVIEHAPAA